MAFGLGLVRKGSFIWAVLSGPYFGGLSPTSEKWVFISLTLVAFIRQQKYKAGLD